MDLRYSFFLFDPYQIRTDIDSVKRKCTNHYTKRPLFLLILLPLLPFACRLLPNFVFLQTKQNKQKQRKSKGKAKETNILLLFFLLTLHSLDLAINQSGKGFCTLFIIYF
jgi:branched-subunit amino acid transport protein AzlD